MPKEALLSGWQISRTKYENDRLNWIELERIKKWKEKFFFYQLIFLFVLQVLKGIFYCLFF